MPVSPRKLGIRLDSGDLAYLSKKARKMLDAAGFEEATICASNDLDEYLIHDLKIQGATIRFLGCRNQPHHLQRLSFIRWCI